MAKKIETLPKTYLLATNEKAKQQNTEKPSSCKPQKKANKQAKKLTENAKVLYA